MWRFRPNFYHSNDVASIKRTRVSVTASSKTWPCFSLLTFSSSHDKIVKRVALIFYVACKMTLQKHFLLFKWWSFKIIYISTKQNTQINDYDGNQGSVSEWGSKIKIREKWYVLLTNKSCLYMGGALKNEIHSDNLTMIYDKSWTAKNESNGETFISYKGLWGGKFYCLDVNVKGSNEGTGKGRGSGMEGVRLIIQTT